jgi:hypothetical protein
MNLEQVPHLFLEFQGTKNSVEEQAEIASKHE